jgi:hypothetical protein
MDWLAHTPMVVVEAHLRMLPRLQAEEQLASMHTVGLAMADPQRAAELRAALVAAAAPPVPPHPPNPAGHLASLGFAVRRVTRQAA